MRGVRLDELGWQLDQGFVGREVALAALDRVLIDERVDRWVALTGGPGRGKTAIVARWLAAREAAHEFVAQHCACRAPYDRIEPSLVARALAAQIEERYPELCDPYARPEARLGELLTRVSARDLAPRGGRLVVAIDGLDEGDLREVLALLPRALPAGVRLLLSGRHRASELDGIADRSGALVRLDLDDPSFADDHDATVRELWRREAGARGLDERFVEHAVRCANGSVLHAALLCRHVATAPVPPRPDAIARGLPALLAALWARVAGDPAALRALGLLCAAREPLSLDQLGRAAGWSSPGDARAALHVARDLVVEVRRDRAGDRTRAHGGPAIRLFHGAIRGLIVEQLGPAAIRNHHRALAGTLATWPGPHDDARHYALQHAIGHCIAAGDCAAVHALACNIDFLEAKCGALGVDAVELDLRRAREACLAGGRLSLAGDLDQLARAIAREAASLRRDARTAGARLWAQLRNTAPLERAIPAGMPDAPRAIGDVKVDGTHPTVIGESAPSQAGRALRRTPGSGGALTTGAPHRPTSRHRILFLAANSHDPDRVALDKEECSAIEKELRAVRYSDDFEFHSKWRVTVDAMAQHLFELEPTIIHFSGSCQGPAASSAEPGAQHARPVGDSGICLHNEDHRAHPTQIVTGRALADMISSTAPSSGAPSARVVVLNACYSDRRAEALAQVVDCVVGTTRAIPGEAARWFAVAFYRALGHRRSIGNAVDHARATLAAKGIADDSAPRCRTRNWEDANAIFL